MSVGEPLNGQLDLPSTSDTTENRDSFSDNDPSIGSMPSRHPGRIPTHVPDNQVLPLQPPRRNRDYNWKQVGSTECSVSCGKGEVGAGKVYVLEFVGFLCFSKCCMVLCVYILEASIYVYKNSLPSLKDSYYFFMLLITINGV